MDFLNAAIAKAQAFIRAQLSRSSAFERDYLIKVAQGQLFWLDDADQPHTNPAYYIGGGLDPNVYVARALCRCADADEGADPYLRQGARARRREIRANLKTPMPISFVNYGMAAFNGFADYYANDAHAGVRRCQGRGAPAAVRALGAKASKAMRDSPTGCESQRRTATHQLRARRRALRADAPRHRGRSISRSTS